MLGFRHHDPCAWHKLIAPAFAPPVEPLREIYRWINQLPRSTPEIDRGILVIGRVGSKRESEIDHTGRLCGSASKRMSRQCGRGELSEHPCTAESLRRAQAPPAHARLSPPCAASGSYALALGQLELDATIPRVGFFGLLRVDWLKFTEPGRREALRRHAPADKILNHRNRPPGGQFPVAFELRAVDR